MGRQVNYFLTPNDMSLLEDRLRKIESLCAITHRSDKPYPNVLENWGVNDKNEHLFIHLTRKTDLKSIFLREIRGQDYWSVDVLSSPVIEFDRCFFNGDVLRRGRMYYTPGFYNSENIWVTKSMEFEKWAKQIFSTVKKMFTYEASRSVYIGLDTYRWMSQPGKRFVFAKTGWEMTLH